MIRELPVVWMQILDVVFFILHSAIVVFNTTGWAFERTRRLHMMCLAATLLSWFGMGVVYGWGYCLCTDWHFQIRRAMGLQDNVHTFLQLVSKVVFNTHMTQQTSNLLAMGGLLLILIATLIVWRRDLFSKRLNS